MAAEGNWQKVDEIYRLALQQDAGRRGEFLREACAGDATLRAEIESLLGYDDKAGSFLEPPEDADVKHSMTEGETFAHYRILEKLGQGGMGVVYKARDTRLNRLVALKMLPRRLMAVPERRARFVQEARAASALNHPNIVTIYDIGEADGRHFIAMEYVEGSTLEKLIPRKGMRIADALRYAIQIAEALGCAHDAGVIHRDLKPANIMVTTNGQAKIVDFGLAKLAEREFKSDDGLTAQGQILGTVSYMSPQQAEGKPLDSRSDIFSFGAVLYEMVTGQRAFHGGTIMSTVAAILHKEPKAASETRRAVSRDLEKIINRCLRKDPERRFQDLADLKVALMELKEASESGVLSALAAKKKNRKGLLWASALLLLAAAASLAAWLREKNDVSPQSVLIATPLTTYPGSESMPSFSPDGNQIAFVWDGQKQDNRDIYVKLIGGGPPIRLTTDPEPDVAPAWSPDGGSIAFWRVRHSKLGMRGELRLIPALGGSERKLLEVPVEQEDDVNSHLEWSPDSRNLFYASPAGPHGPPGLFLLSIATEETRRLTVPAAAAGDDHPAVSPDGRTLAFTRQRNGCLLYLLALSEDYRSSGLPRHVAAAGNWVVSPVWVPDTHEIVYSAFAWPERLWKINATGAGRPELLAFAGDGAHEPAVSRQGHRLAYTRWTRDLNIWRMDVSRGTKTGAAVKLISSTQQDANPSFSPDGKKVAFASNRSGHYEIWVSNSDGSSPVQLTFRQTSSGTPRWFPDGRRIVFDSNTDQTASEQIYAIDAAGGVPQRMTNGPDGAVSPSVSPDGKWIYFSSNGTGGPQVWRVPVAGGPARQITRDGGFGATPSPDGAFLYYQKSNSSLSDLWRIPAEGGNATRVLGPVRNRLFAIRRNGIYFIGPIAGNEERMVLKFQDAVSGTVRQIRAFEKPPWYWGISLSPDERFLLYTQLDAGDSDLMLVENFR